MDTLDLDINMRVNGEDVQARIAPRKTLVDFLRDDLCLTGTHVGCEHGVCGACAVRLDGEVVRGCLVFAVQCDGSRIETIEGLSDSGAIADLQMAFQRRNALQCGYCTPGMLIGAQELLAALVLFRRVRGDEPAQFSPRFQGPAFAGTSGSRAGTASVG